MGRFDRLFGFDKPYDEFELLETESGAPDRSNNEEAGDADNEGTKDDASPYLDFTSIDETENCIRRIFCADVNGDLIIRRFHICSDQPAMIVYMSGMVNEDRINDFILRPLMKTDRTLLLKRRALRRNLDDVIGLLINEAVEIGEVKPEKDTDKVISAVLDGMTALFVAGCSGCIVLETHGYETRAVSAAENEKTVLGPKESFTENIKVNVSMIRRAVKKADLVSEMIPSGANNGVRIAMIYRKGVTNESLVNEVRSRIGRLRPNAVTGSGIIEQLIEERSILPVPRVLSTERPDRASSHIMNGRVCLIIEGSPLALIVPVTLFSLMNSPEDVYMRRSLGSLVRLVRYAGALISILLPGYFLSLALYHQGGLTTEVLSTVITSRKMVFEPIAVEMILLLLVFLLIREAGLRVPGSIGQAIGIIGGLIMGQAAVAANLASSVVLIIVALSGLGNFCIADYSTQISASYFRLAAVIAAWIGGLVGMVAAVLAAVALLAGTKSFGVPFLSPYSPRTKEKRPLILRGRIGNTEKADDYANVENERKHNAGRIERKPN